MLLRNGGDMQNFGEKTAQMLERAYQSADFQRRRLANFDALSPRPGENIVDIGCGNGLLTHDLAIAVGDQGKVTGIEPSEDMAVLAKNRVAGFDNVEITTGTASEMPLDAVSQDGALSVQVFEYVPDIPAVLREVHRVLRPGGRLVIGDMHFGSQVWESDDPERMARMIASWDQHVSDPAVPATLIPALRDAGFDITDVTPLTMFDTELRPNGFSAMTLAFIENFAVTNGHATADEARAWAVEQEERAKEGRFFHMLTHVIISARRQ